MRRNVFLNSTFELNFDQKTKNVHCFCRRWTVIMSIAKCFVKFVFAFLLSWSNHHTSLLLRHIKSLLHNHRKFYNIIVYTLRRSKFECPTLPKNRMIHESGINLYVFNKLENVSTSKCQFEILTCRGWCKINHQWFSRIQ